jgi:DNA-binding transcriptional MerR regulator
MAALKQISIEFETQEVPVTGTHDAGSAAPKKGRKPKAPAPAKQPSKRGRLSMKEATAVADVVEIPEDDILFQKQYYSIGQVAVMFHVNHSLLRLWTNEFDGFIHTRKNKKGDRFYRPEDIKTLQVIHHLLRQRKFTMEGARDFLKKNKSAEERYALVASLQKIKAFLLELKAGL